MKKPLWTLGVLIALAGTPALAEVTLKGPLEQGALVVGQTDPAAQVTLDGQKIMVSPRGFFALGFDRDHAASATLIVTTPDETIETQKLAIAPRAWNIQSITGVASKYVSPPAADLIRIKRERELKAAARPCDTNEDFFAEDFIWPSSGPVSGIFGSQRIFNGEKRNPHFGVDVAAPEGALVVAPADGIVRLAEPDMFYEGGLVFLDHGQGVFSQFLHMSHIDVKVGDRLHQGDPIGRVGKKGRATGPHLHWGMLWCGTRVDPSLKIPGIGAEGAVPGMKASNN
ncbi:MAG: M23 family metallopeptidase [Parvibaculum sp.]|nr:M23 family metallopeptidase [Parvibaculum sp.]